LRRERARVHRETRRRRDLDVDEHAGVGAAAPRALRRRLVGHHGGGASREADLGRHRAEASGVRTADQQQAIAHLHAGHADDERVRIVAFEEHPAGLALSALVRHSHVVRRSIVARRGRRAARS